MTSLIYECIADVPLGERPRERLIKHGAGALSDVELLSLMLGSGGGGKSVYRLAFEVLEVLENGGDITEIDKLQRIPGIGPARAGLVTGSLEFARRRLRPTARRINEPGDVFPMVAHWADRPQEHFLTISLNGAHEVLRLRVVSQGILNRTIVHPREVFADPLADRAAAIVCAHNHPSGNVAPSREDRELTKRLEKAGEILGIPLLDHIVFSNTTYYSFLEDGELSRHVT